MIWWSLIVVCYAANLRDTTLNMEELKATTTSPITITMINERNWEVTFDVDTDYTVGKLVQVFQDGSYWPSVPTFKFNGVALENDKTLASYGIEEGSQLEFHEEYLW
jgi:hypothetical protein